jgi:hypothetical protein
MKNRPKVILSPNNKGKDRTWTLKLNGTQVGQFDDKASGRERGIGISKQIGAEFIAQRLDGTFGEKNTYPRSSDSRNIKG